MSFVVLFRRFTFPSIRDRYSALLKKSNALKLRSWIPSKCCATLKRRCFEIQIIKKTVAYEVTNGSPESSARCYLNGNLNRQIVLFPNRSHLKTHWINDPNECCARLYKTKGCLTDLLNSYYPWNTTVMGKNTFVFLVCIDSSYHNTVKQ